MSNSYVKEKRSRRLHADETSVKKQVKIAKQHGSFPENHKIVKESHRLSKHHAMDCGNPQCFLCGNPRHIHKDSLTYQEKKLFQEAFQDPIGSGQDGNAAHC